MHENWLQKYIKENYRQIGLSRLHGPYKRGADFRGIYDGKWAKIEVEWNYLDYVVHKHTLEFADILVVATLKPAPAALRAKVPTIIININRKLVVDWAQPQIDEKTRQDYHSYPWRRLSRNLLDLYAYYRKKNLRNEEFIGSGLALSMYKVQKPVGFQFGLDGKEERFEGRPEDKDSWDYWLNIAHDVARRSSLKPALNRPTWIDNVGYCFSRTGEVSDDDIRRFKDIALLIEASFQPAKA